MTSKELMDYLAHTIENELRNVKLEDLLKEFLLHLERKQTVAIDQVKMAAELKTVPERSDVAVEAELSEETIPIKDPN